MAKTLKVSELPEEEFISPGTRLCQGCGGQLAYRWALKALGQNTIATVPASCFYSSPWNARFYFCQNPSITYRI